MTTFELTDADRQHLTEAYERAKERHQRRNELLMEIEGRVLIKWQNKWVVSFDGYPDMSSTDLRIIADELDRRNKQ